ncbi:MAG TPA: transporter [Bacteroidales bacterium]|mgnify:FL=1|jgi:BASS family bile acid:Na+ symporter|nr:transporter [Bacteroidales bacterium]HPY80752.1 transporter [Bacteroidales bacterium]HRT13894.1 transporter [Bacteroidales bacterium]
MNKYRSFVLPIALLLSLFFHEKIVILKSTVPILIFSILFLSFSNIDLKKLKFSSFNIWLLAFQFTVSLAAYFIFVPFNDILAQGALLAILCPVASAVVVISCLLGANKEKIGYFSIIGNLSVAVMAPIYFSFIGNQVDMPFRESFLLIFSKMLPIIILPIALSFLFQYFAPKINRFFVKCNSLSFYLWAIALTITLSQTTYFLHYSEKSQLPIIIALSCISLFSCILQYGVGYFIGKKYGDTVAGSQGLGQKNNSLGIWMAYTYLDPLTAIVPASYSIFQNIYNSYRIALKEQKDKKNK